MNNKIGLAVLSVITALIATPVLAQSPAPDSIFTAKCAVCHGDDGLGDTEGGKATETPSLLSPAILKLATADLIATVKNGKGQMPAYGEKLTDAQITNVVAYIETLQKKKP